MARRSARGNGVSTRLAMAFAELLHRIQNGCDDACTALYRRYNRVTLRYVENRVLRPGDPLRGFVEPVDILQETWSTTFAAIQDGKVFPNERALLGFMLKVARNRCRKRFRAQFLTARRDGRRAGRLDPAAYALADRAAGPAATVESCELWAAFLAGLRASDRLVMQCAWLGWTTAEIADRVGLGIREARSTLRKRLGQWETFARRGGKLAAACCLCYEGYVTSCTAPSPCGAMGCCTATTDVANGSIGANTRGINKQLPAVPSLALYWQRTASR